MELADYISKFYQHIFQKKLDISEQSLAVEILIHAYLDLLAKNSVSIGSILPEKVSRPILSLTKALHGKTAVIDCGEKSVDRNRFVFDDLAPFHSLIFSALGKLA